MDVFISHLLTSSLLIARPSQRCEWLVEILRPQQHFPSALLTPSRNLAAALYEPGQYPRAKEIFEKIVSRQPESEPAQQNISSTASRKIGLIPLTDRSDAVRNAQAELQQPGRPKFAATSRSHVESDSRAAGRAPISAFIGRVDRRRHEKSHSQSPHRRHLFASYGPHRESHRPCSTPFLRLATWSTSDTRKIVGFRSRRGAMTAHSDCPPSSTTAFIRSAGTPPAADASENFAADFSAGAFRRRSLAPSAAVGDAGDEDSVRQHGSSCGLPNLRSRRVLLPFSSAEFRKWIFPTKWRASFGKQRPRSCRCKSSACRVRQSSKTPRQLR